MSYLRLDEVLSQWWTLKKFWRGIVSSGKMMASEEAGAWWQYEGYYLLLVASYIWNLIKLKAEGLAWAYVTKKVERANLDWGEEYYSLNGGSFEIIQKLSKTIVKVCVGYWELFRSKVWSVFCKMVALDHGGLRPPLANMSTGWSLHGGWFLSFTFSPRPPNRAWQSDCIPNRLADQAAVNDWSVL